jgi:hypothetical protein
MVSVLKPLNKFLFGLIQGLNQSTKSFHLLKMLLRLNDLFLQLLTSGGYLLLSLSDLIALLLILMFEVQNLEFVLIFTLRSLDLFSLVLVDLVQQAGDLPFSLA